MDEIVKQGMAKWPNVPSVYGWLSLDRRGNRLIWDSTPNAVPHLETHTKRAVTEIHGVWIDEAGVVLIESEHGIGLVDDRDLERLLAGFTDVRGVVQTEDTIAA